MRGKPRAHKLAVFRLPRRECATGLVANGEIASGAFAAD
jgi:hypothetical protein